MERRGNNDAADLRDGDGVERVGNVRTRPDLQTPFPQPNQKVVSYRDAGSWIPRDVPRANDRAHQATPSSLAHDKLACPFRLPIPSAQTLATAFQIIRLQHGRSS